MTASKPSKRLVRIVRPGSLPSGVTGSPWPRREHRRGCGYRGRTISFHWFGVFIGRLDESEQRERRRLESV